MSPVHLRLRGAAVAACLALTLSPASAAPTAVDLIFEAPYLSKAADGSTISYRFVRKTDEKDLQPSFEDDVTLNVGPTGAEKTVTIDMFTGARAISMANMARSGNPVVIAVLEQDVREMQKVLGGSPYYIRNRIMDAMRNDRSAEPVKLDYAGRTVDGWKIKLSPFASDQHRAQLKDFADRTYELTFADDVPGGLYALKSVTPKKDGGALLVEELTLKDSAATLGASKP
ncbi:MAG TPA: hypothetical protein VGC51_11810 [Hansschlegelia sp.]